MCGTADRYTYNHAKCGERCYKHHPHPPHQKTYVAFKEGVFYRVLIFTSAIDILSALAFILQINCAARKATAASEIATIIISVSTQSPLYFKYIVLLFSAVDRWLAMYKITYKSNLFVAKFTLWTLLSFIAATMIAIAKDLALMDDICLDSVFGVNNCSDGTAQLVCVGAASIHFLLIALFAILIAVELKKMKHCTASLRQLPPARKLRNERLRRTAYYVIITVMLYIFCFVPYLLYVILDVVEQNNVIENYRIKEVGGVLNSCYGLLNIVALALTHRLYSSPINALVQWCKNCR